MATWLRETFELTAMQANLVLSVVVISLLLLLWSVVVRVITRRVDDSSVWYAARKTTSYIIAAVAVVSMLWLWIGALQNFATFLGLAAAGIALALADVLKNFVGWLYILLRRPWRVDDRVEVAGVAGDVIDIRLFRTTLLEIGNWVDADQSTGRLVHVPNGKVFSEHVFNSTEGFGYVWHEVSLQVTFESDWQRAERLMLEALESAAGHTVDEAAQRIRRASKAYKIRYTHLGPTVYVTVKDSGITLTGRILVDARRRRAVDQQVWRSLLTSIAAEPDVAIAYATTRTYLREPLRVQQEDGTMPLGASGLADTGVGRTSKPADRHAADPAGRHAADDADPADDAADTAATGPDASRTPVAEARRGTSGRLT